MGSKKVIIVGAGPGGLTAGMILAKRGFEVEVFEKKDRVGGRNTSIALGNYKFDTGPTFLMMNFILKEMFEEAGKIVEDYLVIKRLDPLYRLSFYNFDFFPSSDSIKTLKSMEKVFPGNEEGYKQYMKEEAKRYGYLFPCIQKEYSTWKSMFSFTLLKAIPHLGLSKTLYDNLGRYFEPEKLKLSFTFQSKYLGMSPWDCPSLFTMLSYVEHAYGISHVIGGLNRISEAMKEVLIENGGKISLSTPVHSLIIEKKKVKGVVLANKEKVYADEIIINADFGSAMTSLVEPGILKKYSPDRLAKKDYSCSTFMLYLGIDKKYEMAHHNIFFAKDYRNNIDSIFKEKRLVEDFSFYVQNASVTDNSLAPSGHSTIYVLVPTPNQDSEIDWEKEKPGFRNKVLDLIMKRTEMKDIKDHIQEEKIITPSDWLQHYDVYKGGVFNLSHKLTQMLYLRPRNRFEELENCYLVGGGTHPGSGLPTIYESARISSNLICKKYNVFYSKPGPLKAKSNLS